MTNLISQSVTGVFVKRPRRHQIKTCSLVSVYSAGSSSSWIEPKSSSWDGSAQIRDKVKIWAGSARACTSFEFPSSAPLRLIKMEIYKLSSAWARWKWKFWAWPNKTNLIQVRLSCQIFTQIYQILTFLSYFNPSTLIFVSVQSSLELKSLSWPGSARLGDKIKIRARLGSGSKASWKSKLSSARAQ